MEDEEEAQEAEEPAKEESDTEEKEEELPKSKVSSDIFSLYVLNYTKRRIIPEIHREFPKLYIEKYLNFDTLLQL